MLRKKHTPGMSLINSVFKKIKLDTLSVTQYLLGEYKNDIQTPDLTKQHKAYVKTLLNRDYLQDLNKINPIDAITALSEADKNDSSSYHFKKENPPLYSLIKKISHIFDQNLKEQLGLQNSYDLFKYVHKRINKKIIEVALEKDILGKAFSDQMSIEQIAEFMNIITRSMRFLQNDTYYFQKSYQEEHISTLKYLLTDKKLLPSEVIREIRDLNCYQAEALKNLYNKGLRGTHLRMFKKNHEIHAYFSYEHRNALNFLIEKLSPEKAIAEINGLSEDQVKALIKLFDRDLRGDHLRAWDPGKHAVFGNIQEETIRYLMTEQHLNPSDAVKQINQLPYQCCLALQSLYSLGLRGEHLVQKGLLDAFSRYSDDICLKALISLVRYQNVPLETALDDIKKIEDQAWYIKSLGKLYPVGLRVADLQTYESDSDTYNNFTRSHYKAVAYLIEQGLTPRDAVKEISRLSDYAASAVKEFYKLGLRGADLRDWNYNGEFYFEHERTLLILISKEKMSVKDALNNLKKMTSYEVYVFEKTYEKMKYSPKFFGNRNANDATVAEDKELNSSLVLCV